HLDQPLADKDHLGDFRDTGNPRIADELRIKLQQPIRLFRVAGGGGLPLEHAGGAVEFPDSVDIGDKVVSARDRPGELDLLVAAGPKDANPVVLGKAVE